jgi:putative 4-mercaptohistidine N1-methyltranferase
MNIYETDTSLQEYLEFHYGDRYFDTDNYPAICAKICLNTLQNHPKKKALDLGCAVGRTAFELAQAFDEVTAIDLSNNFINTAKLLQQQGQLNYLRTEEGELKSPRTADLEKLGLAQYSQRINFIAGDACQLDSSHKDYDLIFAGNLIDRLQDPAAFLQTIHQYLADNGFLILASPYTLLEEFTPRENWVGGFMQDGQAYSVLDGLKTELGEHFTLVSEPQDIPFVIRETRRKFQHTIAQLSIWQRK